MPYTGVQYVAIPEFQAIGTTVGQLVAAALTGQQTVDGALKQAQASVTAHDAAGRLHAVACSVYGVPGAVTSAPDAVLLRGRTATMSVARPARIAVRQQRSQGPRRPAAASDRQAARSTRCRCWRPPSALLLIWMIVPLAMTLYFAFRRYNLLNPMIHGWAGFANYRIPVRGPGALPVAPGLGDRWSVGVLDHHRRASAPFWPRCSTSAFPGRGIARVLVISPFFVMPTVSALIWKNLLMNPVNGLIACDHPHGSACSPIDWFGSFPLTSIIAIVCWEWLPFAFLILFTALQSLDEEQLRGGAARRCERGRQLPLSIQVPHMARAISVMIMIETIFLLGIFAEIYVTTAGGPGIATTNLTFLIYQRALLAFNVGGASAAGVIAIILANIVCRLPHAERRARGSRV